MIIGRTGSHRYMIGYRRLQVGDTTRVLRVYREDGVLVRQVKVVSVNDGKLKARLIRQELEQDAA